MPIALSCPGCSKQYSLADNLAGKRAKCNCGQTLVVPPLPAPVTEELFPDLGGDALGSSDGSLFDELPAGFDAVPAPTNFPAQPAALAASSSPAATPKKKKKKKKKGGLSKTMIGLIAGGSVVGVLVVGTLFVLLIAFAMKGGYGSPTDAVEAYQVALGKKDWSGQFKTLNPESQKKVLGKMITTLQPDVSSSPEISQVIVKYGGDAMLTGTPDFSRVGNLPIFYSKLVRAMTAEEEKHMPRNALLKTLQKKPMGEARRTLARAKITELEVDGDSAKCNLMFMVDKEEFRVPVDLKKVSGRWFLHVVDVDSFAHSPLGNVFGAGGAIYTTSL